MAKPHQLSKRTKLRPDQLDRVKGGSGNGESSKYRPDGVQSLELTRRLMKAKKKAKRFILFTDHIGRRLYVADPKLIDVKEDEVNITFNRKEALQFFHGFDDPKLVVDYYDNFLTYEACKFFTEKEGNFCFNLQTLNI